MEQMPGLFHSATASISKALSTSKLEKLKHKHAKQEKYSQEENAKLIQKIEKPEMKEDEKQMLTEQIAQDKTQKLEYFVPKSENEKFEAYLKQMETNYTASSTIAEEADSDFSEGRRRWVEELREHMMREGKPFLCDDFLLSDMSLPIRESSRVRMNLTDYGSRSTSFHSSFSDTYGISPASSQMSLKEPRTFLDIKDITQDIDDASADPPFVEKSNPFDDKTIHVGQRRRFRQQPYCRRINQLGPWPPRSHDEVSLPKSEPESGPIRNGIRKFDPGRKYYSKLDGEEN